VRGDKAQGWLVQEPAGSFPYSDQCVIPGRTSADRNRAEVVYTVGGWVGGWGLWGPGVIGEPALLSFSMDVCMEWLPTCSLFIFAGT
jgi:hypothetical protein